MSSSSSSYLLHLCSQLRSQPPFDLLKQDSVNSLFAESKLVQLEPGQTLIAPQQLQERIYLVVSGKVRLLALTDSDIETLDLRGAGQFLGWSSLLRGGACEWVTASEPTVCLSFTSKSFLNLILSESNFYDWFSSLTQPQETYLVASSAIQISSKRFEDWKEKLKYSIDNAVALTLDPGSHFPVLDDYPNFSWHLSTEGVPGLPVGSLLRANELLPLRDDYLLRYRIIGMPNFNEVIDQSTNASNQDPPISQLEKLGSVSLEDLGIVESDHLEDDDIYPLIKGKGVLQEAMATCEMISLLLKVPFRRDGIKKLLEDQFRRDKSLTLELLAGLTEGLGLRTQLGSVDNAFIGSIEPPAFLMWEGIPVVIFEVKSKVITLGHPHRGLLKVSLEEFQQQLGETIRFAVPRRIGSTPTKRFGWNWFTPLLAKYKKPLILVFVSSLLAQLFGLGIPLLIQQIIDKVLSR